MEIAVNFRIKDAETWRKFREISASYNQSANGLLNTVLEQYVARHKVPAPQLKALKLATKREG